MCCTEAIARILVFVANFVFLLVGVALLSVGILYTVHFSKYTDAIPADYQAIHYVPTIAIVVGSIIFFISFLGCCGTLRSSTCMLTTYAAILLIIFFLQVGLGVFAFVEIKNEDDLQSQVTEKINTLFSKYNNRSTDISGVINVIQQNLRCCGTDSPSFWNNELPSSCYLNYDTSDKTKLFEQGCSNALFSFITSSIRTIAIVALSISLVEVVGAVLALFLSNCIKSDQRRGAYY